MSLGDVRVMVFYGRPEIVNLRYSVRFITITFLKYSFTAAPGSKTIAFIQCFINFGQTSRGRLNMRRKVMSAQRLPWDVPRTSSLKVIQKALLFYYFRLYSPNLLREIRKSQLLHVLTFLEKPSADVLKTSRKAVRRMTSILNLLQKCNFTALFSVLFYLIWFDFISKSVPVTLKSQLFCSLKFLEKRPRDVL